VPRPKREGHTRATFTLPIELVEFVESTASERDTSRNRVVQRALELYRENLPPLAPAAGPELLTEAARALREGR
jgi:hypothetical protein